MELEAHAAARSKAEQLKELEARAEALVIEQLRVQMDKFQATQMRQFEAQAEARASQRVAEFQEQMREFEARTEARVTQQAEAHATQMKVLAQTEAQATEKVEAQAMSMQELALTEAQAVEKVEAQATQKRVGGADRGTGLRDSRGPGPLRGRLRRGEWCAGG